jgi:1-acyl-sn-glycerol-3-phosphate acyltransferase
LFLTIVKIVILFPISLILSIGAFFSVPFVRKGRLFRWFPLIWSKIILWAFGIRVIVKGKEHLENGKPYFLVSNHASMADIPAVMVALDGNVNFVFKKELTYVPIWGWALRFGPFIMIDRSHPRDAILSIERAARSIQNGSSVIMFPEGTRTRDGKMQPFKRGAFSLALKAGVPIVPVTINNTFGILPKGNITVRPANISVVLGKPISTTGFDGKSGELKLMEKVHKAINLNYIEQS